MKYQLFIGCLNSLHALHRVLCEQTLCIYLTQVFGACHLTSGESPRQLDRCNHGDTCQQTKNKYDAWQIETLYLQSFKCYWHYTRAAMVDVWHWLVGYLHAVVFTWKLYSFHMSLVWYNVFPVSVEGWNFQPLAPKHSRCTMPKVNKSLNWSYQKDVYLASGRPIRVIYISTLALEINVSWHTRE